MGLPVSRCGRAIEFLSSWREHPKGCTADHGWADGYDGPCTDDPWDVAQTLDDIDPFFRHDEILRLRTLVKLLNGSEILERLEGPNGKKYRHVLDTMARDVATRGPKEAQAYWRAAAADWKASGLGG